LVVLAAFVPSVLAAEPAKWDKAAAAKYLDSRAAEWFAWGGSSRGQGATKSSCVSCHTVMPFALGRPALRRLASETKPSAFETRLLEQTRRRVENWAKLDTPPYGLFYDFSDIKKKESWGTEAVLNALLLAADDRDRGRAAPEEITRKALANLWAVQVKEGDQKGSWDWLNFGMDPWESPNSRYFGAALAAGAVGTAPGYYKAGADAALDGRVELLRTYLRSRLDGQNLFNRAWVLWASARLPGLLSKEQQKQIVSQLVAQQQADGGWRLASLGTYKRGDGAAQDKTSDGYATGLVVYVLRSAGLAKDEPAVAKGLDWLRANQDPSGAWRGSSVNRRRDPTTHTGKFMSDAATGFALLALAES
jgi:squalene-hopene/tetraprenyl-beta-curcumene cyclase